MCLTEAFQARTLLPPHHIKFPKHHLYTSKRSNTKSRHPDYRVNPFPFEQASALKQLFMYLSPEIKPNTQEQTHFLKSAESCGDLAPNGCDAPALSMTLSHMRTKTNNKPTRISFRNFPQKPSSPTILQVSLCQRMGATVHSISSRNATQTLPTGISTSNTPSYPLRSLV